jgi:hypothetical protein
MNAHCFTLLLRLLVVLAGRGTAARTGLWQLPGVQQPLQQSTIKHRLFLQATAAAAAAILSVSPACVCTCNVTLQATLFASVPMHGWAQAQSSSGLLWA